MNSPATIAIALVVQVICAAFFVANILLSVLGVPVPLLPWRVMELMEIGAAIGLLLGIVMAGLALRASRRRLRTAERIRALQREAADQKSA